MRDNHFAVQATCLSRMRRELAVPVAPISLQRPLEQGALSLVGLPLRPKGICQDITQSCMLRSLHSILEASPTRVRNAR